MPPRTFRLDRLTLLVGGLYLGIVAVEWAVTPVPVLRPLLAALLVGVLPGALLMAVLGLSPAVRADRIIYAVGISLLIVMATGLALHLLGPVVGEDAPLTFGPVLAGMLLVIGGLLLAGRYRGVLHQPFAIVPGGPLSPAPLAFALLPPFSIIAVYALNLEWGNVPVLLVLVSLSLVPLGVVHLDIDEEYLPFGIFAMALAVVYHKSLWRAYVFSGHASTVAIWKVGRWDPTAETLLPNAILWPGVAHLAGVDILTQLKVLNPFVVALIPVMLFVGFRRITTARRAFLGAALFAFAHPFYLQYPPAGRAAMPVFYLALVGVVLGDPDLGPTLRRSLALLFATGIVVSHYGTSYYVMFGLVGALGLLAALRLVDGYRPALTTGDPPAADGGVLPGHGASIIDRTFVLYYVIAALAWYLFTGGGRRFTSLVEHVVTAYGSLARGGSTGSTAVRLATSYNAPSIRLAKILYLIVGLLMGLGLLLAYYRRFHPTRTAPVDDGYLALGSLLLGLYGTTFVVAGQWGGGRPMMIVLSVTGVFAVLGADVAWSGLARVIDSGLSGSVTDRVTDVGPTAIAGFLLVFFLINSGTAATLVMGGFAPSNVPLQPEFETADRPEIQSLLYVESDVRTHAWLVDHRDPAAPIFGDRITRGQATDKYAGEIAARSNRPLYRFKKKNHLSALEPPGIESGYVILLGHNVEHGTVSFTFVQAGQLDQEAIELDRREKVYANDHGAIYYRAGSTETTGE